MIGQLFHTTLLLIVLSASQPSDSSQPRCLIERPAIFHVSAPDFDEEVYPDGNSLPDCNAKWTIEQVTDTLEIHRVTSALATLNTCREIDTLRAALELFAEAYSESFLDQIRSDPDDPGTWSLERTSFDGTEPDDYYLYIYNDGSISSYEEMIIVRSANRITLQSLWGVGRGRNNVFARAKNRDEAAARSFFTGLDIWPSSLTRHPIDLNHDGISELYEFDMFTKGFEFAELDYSYSCLPAVYSWDGERFTCDTELNQDFKQQLLHSLNLLDPLDSAAIEWRIKKEAE